MRKLIIPLLALSIFIGFATTGFAFFYTFEDEFAANGDPVQQGRGDMAFTNVARMYSSSLPLLLPPDILQLVKVDGSPVYLVSDGTPVYWSVTTNGGFSEDSETGAIRQHPGGTLHVKDEFAMTPEPIAAAVGYDEIKIDFLNTESTFKANYSSKFKFYVDAHYIGDNFLTTFSYDPAGVNDATNRMGTVEILPTPGKLMDYVVLHDELTKTSMYGIDLWKGTGEPWVVDNIVPEPSTVLLLAGGLFTFLGYRRFRRI